MSSAGVHQAVCVMCCTTSFLHPAVSFVSSSLGTTRLNLGSLQTSRTLETGPPLTVLQMIRAWLQSLQRQARMVNPLQYNLKFTLGMQLPAKLESLHDQRQSGPHEERGWQYAEGIQDWFRANTSPIRLHRHQYPRPCQLVVCT